MLPSGLKGHCQAVLHSDNDSMHTAIVLQCWLAEACPFIHARRLQTLLLAVEALVQGQRLTLSDLGRHLPGAGSARHGIKRIDRLLGNRHLHAERCAIYRALAARLLAEQSRPIVLVDWSDLAPIGGRQKHVMLKAALSVQGRAITLHEEVHTLAAQNRASVHRRFLERLASILPAHCRPVIVSDAGFRGPWFEAVEAQGWDWLGRVRGVVHYRTEGAKHWQAVSTLHASATPVARSIGAVRLGKRRRTRATLVLVRKYVRGRGRPRRGRSSAAKEGRKRHKEPWLLASSLSTRVYRPERLVALYSRRMQIELTFRDDKGCRFGWQLDYSGSRTVERRQVLLLIAALATLVAWLAGLAAERDSRAQAVHGGSSRARRTHSTVFTGRQALRRAPPWLTDEALESILALLPLALMFTADFLIDSSCGET